MTFVLSDILNIHDAFVIFFCGDVKLDIIMNMIWFECKLFIWLLGFLKAISLE